MTLVMSMANWLYWVEDVVNTYGYTGWKTLLILMAILGGRHW